MNINCYWKYIQQTELHPNYKKRAESRNVIRFEVQSKYPKLYMMTRNIRTNSQYAKHALSYINNKEFDFETITPLQDSDDIEICEEIVADPSIPLDIVLADSKSEEIVSKMFYKIIKRGDYFSLEAARQIVKSHQFRKEKEERIIWALETISDAHGIANAKSGLLESDKRDFKRSLNDLDAILVNPVTIPQKWNIKYIPNPLQRYYDMVYEEELVSEKEKMARAHINVI